MPSNFDPSDHSRRWLGEYGELLAASWLRASGLKLLRQRFRWGRSGEVDIVYRDGNVLVFAEVKLTSHEDAHPARQVDGEKRDLIRQGARDWMMLLPPQNRHIVLRFDIIELWLRPAQLPKIRLLKDAFGMVEGRGRPIY